jgi:hypothetical protein
MRRRDFVFFLAGAIPFAASAARAQTQANPFLGSWTDHVANQGEVRLTISAIKRNGRGEGRMEFPRELRAYTFGETVDSKGLVAVLTVHAPTAVIETPAGRYDLKLAGSRLAGTYITRGGTKTPVRFKK